MGEDGAMGSAKDIEHVSRILTSGNLHELKPHISSRPVLRRRSKIEATPVSEEPAETTLPIEAEGVVREEPATAPAQSIPARNRSFRLYEGRRHVGQRESWSSSRKDTAS